MMSLMQSFRYLRCSRGLVFCAIALALFADSASEAVENVSFKRDGTSFHLSGKVVVEAVDGSLILHTPDNHLWMIQAKEITDRSSDSKPFHFYGKDELSKRLLEEMPDGFRIHQTANYVICYNTSETYAEWCGALYERLHFGFYSFWKNQGLTLKEADAPLVALVFADKEAYVEYASREMGPRAEDTIGYYSFMTNRVTMFDLTGADRLPVRGRRPQSAAHINLILSQPKASRTVATIVHEATHQLAFNCGLQLRLADIPMWLSEGIAMYFETPDLRSSKGWRTVGKVNRFHLTRFRDSLKKRNDDSLITLIQDDKRLRGAEGVRQAYSESWALNYFLIRNHREQYLEYLKLLSKKEPNQYDSPEDRIAEFRRFFGDLKSLDEEFLRSMRRLR